MGRRAGGQLARCCLRFGRRFGWASRVKERDPQIHSCDVQCRCDLQRAPKRRDGGLVIELFEPGNPNVVRPIGALQIDGLGAGPRRPLP
jgi:hypothetical protein